MKSLRLAPDLASAVLKFQRESLGGGYVAVHFRAGRVWNKAKVTPGGVYIRERHDDGCMEALMRQPFECAEKLADMVHAIMVRFLPLAMVL